MNKFSIALASLVLLAPAISTASVNYKKTYCGNVEFLGNPATKRPHLHCGVNFIAYKKANGDHSNITDFGTCNRTNAVFDEVKANRSAFADYQAIYNALVLYHQAGCPSQLLPLSESGK